MMSQLVFEKRTNFGLMNATNQQSRKLAIFCQLMVVCEKKQWSYFPKKKNGTMKIPNRHSLIASWFRSLHHKL
jgi:hypothetical protein